MDYHGNNVRLPEPIGPQLFPEATHHGDPDQSEGRSGRRDRLCRWLFAGWSLYVEDGKPNFRYTFFDIADVNVPGTVKLPEGEVTLKMEFTPDGSKEGGGTVKLFVNDAPAGEGKLARTRFAMGWSHLRLDGIPSHRSTQPIRTRDNFPSRAASRRSV